MLYPKWLHQGQYLQALKNSGGSSHWKKLGQLSSNIYLNRHEKSKFDRGHDHIIDFMEEVHRRATERRRRATTPLCRLRSLASTRSDRTIYRPPTQPHLDTGSG